MGSAKDAPELIKDGKRVDGRTPEDMRDVKIEAGVLKEADGSAYVEWGGNKVICGVYGPRECIPKHEASPYKALVKCRYTMTTFASVEGHGRSGPNRRSREISKVLTEALESVVLANEFPKTQIDVDVIILQAEGGTRITALTAAMVALADAGVPMKDMISGVAVGKAGGVLCVDLGRDEDNYGESDIPVAFKARSKDIVLLQMDGLLTKDEISQVLDMAAAASEKLNGIQGEALRKEYERTEKKESFKM